MISPLILIFAAAAQGAPAEYAPPELRTPPSKCRCVGETPDDLVIFNGIVTGAEMRADETGFNPDPRQATVFNVIRVLSGDASDPAKIWHVTNADDCGVRFDYGRQYTVRARKADSSLETDACLMQLEDNDPAG